MNLQQRSCVMTDTSDKIPATTTKIEINLSRLPQLFNSLDPSPFLERDLDRDAEDYIVGQRLSCVPGRMHPPEMSNLRATAAEVGNRSKKFVNVYAATSLLNGFAFGGDYQFFLCFDLTFRQNPCIVSFALDDCDSCLGVTANQYNRPL